MFDNKNIIRVHIVSGFSEHDGLGVAVKSGRQQLAIAKSRLKEERVIGEIIEAVKWSDTQVFFKFSNGKRLRIFVHLDGVDWTIENSDQLEMIENDFPRNLQLQYQNDSQPKLWQRASILEKYIGCPFSLIVHSGNTIFFYSKQCPVLFFCVLQIDGANGKNMLLSWDESAE